MSTKCIIGVQSGMSKYVRTGNSHSTFREKWGTFWGAFKMMLLPLAMVGGCLLIAYLILFLILKFA